MEGVQVVGNSQCSVAFREQYSRQVSLEHMGSDVDAVTKSGRLFHPRAAATGSCCGCTTLRLVGQTSSMVFPISVPLNKIYRFELEHVTDRHTKERYLSVA